MNLWQTVKSFFGQPAASKSTPPRPPAEPEPEEAPVREVTPVQVQQALAGAAPPVLLDVREPFEWSQVRVPGALHIPMNSVPDRLAELPRSRPIVVFCAQGSRSYGVTHYLRQQGFDAANLKGGITRWRIEGGQVNVG